MNNNSVAEMDFVLRGHAQSLPVLNALSATWVCVSLVVDQLRDRDLRLVWPVEHLLSPSG